MKARTLIALTVFGGWRIAEETSWRSADGWEADYDTDGLDPTVWPTEAECLAAIEQQHGVKA